MSWSHRPGTTSKPGKAKPFRSSAEDVPEWSALPPGLAIATYWERGAETSVIQFVASQEQYLVNIVKAPFLEPNGGNTKSCEKSIPLDQRILIFGRLLD